MVKTFRKFIRGGGGGGLRKISSVLSLYKATRIAREIWVFIKTVPFAN